MYLFHGGPPSWTSRLRRALGIVRDHQGRAGCARVYSPGGAAVRAPSRACSAKDEELDAIDGVRPPSRTPSSTAPGVRAWACVVHDRGAGMDVLAVIPTSESYAAKRLILGRTGCDGKTRSIVDHPLPRGRCLGLSLPTAVCTRRRARPRRVAHRSEWVSGEARVRPTHRATSSRTRPEQRIHARPGVCVRPSCGAT